MAAHYLPTPTFLYTMAAASAALSACIAICANWPRLLSKVRWGRHGRGYPMSTFGARSWSVYLISFGSVFAAGTTNLHWLQVCSYVFFGVCFIEMFYAALRDRSAYRNRRVE